MSLELEDQYEKIYKYCYFKVKNRHLAEDLTQETFLKFFIQHTYISRGKPLAYLYTIAKNLCTDSYKKLAVDNLDEVEMKESMFEVLERNITLEEAVRSLSQELQEIIMLRFVNELSMAEISKITGISRFSIHRKINKALRQLKVILREEAL
ncbi:MAG: RNA polymerase sigma factor [Zhenhengia sp.]|uniref:RNA polymerase sigma factor n=1 Tax=Zhenhengia sp. TaxID=2944208 RepID=UPI002914DDF1|nr:RNA polymerase sigma factor [Clostridiales bacterium]MDU6974422.1 RNA polymerase sigma factor [Clostridiales bacterium]